MSAGTTVPHRLSDIDSVARTATCAACGPTRVHLCGTRPSGSVRYRCEDPARKRRHALRRKFGISVEEYDALHARQGGRCAICRGTNVVGRMLAVDHCHATGAVRGLLCGACNTALGSFRDDVERLHAAVHYLAEVTR